MRTPLEVLRMGKLPEVAEKCVYSMVGWGGTCSHYLFYLCGILVYTGPLQIHSHFHGGRQVLGNVIGCQVHPQLSSKWARSFPSLWW